MTKTTQNIKDSYKKAYEPTMKQFKRLRTLAMILKVLFTLFISSTSIYSFKREYRDSWSDRDIFIQEEDITQLENDYFPKLQVIDLDKLKEKEFPLTLIDYDYPPEKFISFQSIDTSLNKFLEIFIYLDINGVEKVGFKLVKQRYSGPVGSYDTNGLADKLELTGILRIESVDECTTRKNIESLKTIRRAGKTLDLRSKFRNSDCIKRKSGIWKNEKTKIMKETINNRNARMNMKTKFFLRKYKKRKNKGSPKHDRSVLPKNMIKCNIIISNKEDILDYFEDDEIWGIEIKDETGNHLKKNFVLQDEDIEEEETRLEEMKLISRVEKHLRNQEDDYILENINFDAKTLECDNLVDN